METEHPTVKPWMIFFFYSEENGFHTRSGFPTQTMGGEPYAHTCNVKPEVWRAVISVQVWPRAHCFFPEPGDLACPGNFGS